MSSNLKRGTRVPRSLGVEWQSTAAGLEAYRTTRTEAQEKADATGFDHGIERNDLFKTFRTFMLPQKRNRYGLELRCEVVSPTDLLKCQPGHGPCA